MVSGYPTKEDKVNKRLKRLKELLMGYQATNRLGSDSHKVNSTSQIDNQLREWAENFEIMETEFPRLVQQLVRSSR